MENDILSLDFEESIRLRESHISGSCQLHFGDSPVRIVRSQGQFLFDDAGEKYLDFGSRITNVGHCHPRVVAAGCAQMETLNVTENGVAQNDLQEQYTRALLATLPPNFEVCLFTSSGAEANDLALQLAKLYTGKKGIVAVENAFHGAVSSLIDISPKAFKRIMSGKKPWVHVVPLPDMYRGRHAAEIDAAEKYFNEAKDVIDRGRDINGGIGCFISESVFVVQGTVIPPPGWLAKIYSYIRSIGGITIADEIQTGMGRCGSHFWAFQTQQDAVPDIVTVGKPLGNGYPIAAVITSKKIASAAFRTGCTFNCDPVGASIGLAVLETIKAERLLEHTTEMSKKIYENMLKLKAKSRIIGDVRCIGLMVGVDIVWSKESRKPSSELAEKISYRFKDKHIIVANEGEYNNVLNFMPPLCVTAQDLETVDLLFERILSDIEFENSDDIFNTLLTNQPSSSHQSNYNHTYPSTSGANWTLQRGDNNTISDDSNDSTVDPSYDSMD